MAVAALAEAGAALRPPGLDRAPPRRSATSCSAQPAAAADGRWLRSWQGGPRPRPPGLRRGPRLAGRGVHPPGRGDRRRPGGSPRPGRAADALLDLFGTLRTEACSHDRPRRRAADRPADRQPGRRRARRPTRWPPSPCSAWPPSPAMSPLRRRRRRRSAGSSTPARGPAARSPSPTCWWPPTWPAGAHRGGGDRRPARPARARCERRYLPAAVLAWGEPYPSPLWEGRDRGRRAGQGLRVPRLRLPGPDASSRPPWLDELARARARLSIGPEPLVRHPPLRGRRLATMSTRARLATAPDFSSRRQGPAAGSDRRRPAPTLELLVLVGGRHHCAGVDLASGALVRAWMPDGRVHARLRHLRRGRRHPRRGPRRRPRPPRARGGRPDRAPGAGRRLLRAAGCERMLRPLAAPAAVSRCSASAPRPCRSGSASADHPSIAVVEPEGPITVVARQGPLPGLPVRLAGRTTGAALPRLPALPRGMMDRTGRTRLATGQGDRLLVALTPPIDGHCHKVVSRPAAPALSLSARRDPATYRRVRSAAQGGVSATRPGPRPSPTRRR